MKDKIKLVLGTMTFGPQVDLEGSKQMIDMFLNNGNHEIDTAYVYNEGDTERILGKLLDYEAVQIATKINPRITGKLDAEAVVTQFNESLVRLNTNKVDLLYFHFPDPNTPVVGALEAMQKLFEQGKITQFGLSNYPAWEVANIWHICDKNDWLKPTVYQGMYNGLSRNIEKELFPLIRELGISMYAYNPLAGGLLSGKYRSYEGNPTPGRFTFRPNYKDRYWKESFFQALEILFKNCDENQLSLVEAAFRWLAFHSKMDASKGDGIILGASKSNHLNQNLSFFKKGPLPSEVVLAFDKAWEETKADSPDYFRYIPSNS